MSTHKIPVFLGNLVIRGKIETKTGLHIGGSKEKMQIGGVDLVVIRNPRNNQPYIPGSSFKGKMRHLLEYVTGGVNEPFGGVLGNVSVRPEIVRLFGIGAEVTELAHDSKQLEKEMEKAKGKGEKDYLANVRALKDVGLPRLIFRDAYPDAGTVADWTNLGSDSDYTEYKAENTIDRLTSAANPRFIERVTEGSWFDFEIVYTAYGNDPAGPSKEELDVIDADIRNLLAGLRLLENSALGKAGTRGYGKVKFHVAKPLWLLTKDYLEGTPEKFDNNYNAPLSREGLLSVSGSNQAFYYPTNQQNA